MLRTTITIPDHLVERAKQVTGKEGPREAIVESLIDYFRLKNRLALLDDLFDRPVSHSITKIRQDRRRRTWSA